MNQQIILKIERGNQTDQESTRLMCFPDLGKAEEHLRTWLETACGLDCYCGSEEEQALRERNAGALPALSFACPKMEQPKDLENYNGHYFYEYGGAISLFVMAIWDADSARSFRKAITKEYALDSTFSDEADLMMELLSRLERSFQEVCDIQLALEQIDGLIASGGLSLF